MKKIIVLLMASWSAVLFGQVPSGGVPVSGYISPFDITDNYAVTHPWYGLGGLRNVTNSTGRAAIPAARKQPGMFAYQSADLHYYGLDADNSTWLDLGTVLFRPLAANVILGNNSVSAGPALSLSPSTVTSMMDVMVGDSGGGGTKGLVPAPGVGDTAAGKFLKANGQWAVPPNTGGSTPGGSDTYFNFNDGGTTFGGAPGATYTKATGLTTIGKLTVSTNATINAPLVYGQTAASVSGAITLDCSKGNEFTIAPTADFTLTLSNVTVGQRILIITKQDTTARTWTLNSNFKFGTDVAGAVLSTTSGVEDYLTVHIRSSTFWNVLSFVKGYTAP